jgi:DNA protecting protein DprA
MVRASKKKLVSGIQPGLGFADFRISLLALSTIRGLGINGLKALVDHFKGGLELIWDSPLDTVQDVLVRAKNPASEKVIAEIKNNALRLLADGKLKIKELTDRNIHVIPHSELPPTLREIPDAPRWLFVHGEREILYRQPAIAVVGTRKPSPRGLSATSHVIRVLGAYDVVVVSGLAEGIDEQAHRVSLSEGMKNIAFLGHGINIVFPASTKEIREKIVETGGAIVTEYLPDDHYKKLYFVERNRLQAALANLIIPVEANPKGGTAHTVRYARKYNRPLAGVRWEDANGILEELAKSDVPVFDIFTRNGLRGLDRFIQEVVQRTGQKVYPLSSMERRFQVELQIRSISRKDMNTLIRNLKRLAKELPDEHS